MNDFPEYGEPSENNVWVRGMDRAVEPRRQLLPPINLSKDVGVETILETPPQPVEPQHD